MAPIAKTKLEVGFRRRDHRIDVLRGLAIGIVLVHHFYLAYVVSGRPVESIPAHLLQVLGRNGNYGVIVFFVISGYLITSTSLRRFGDLQRLSARTFYVFRAARIFPCLVLILAIVTIFGEAQVPFFRNSHNVSFFVADLSVLTFWHNVLMAKDGWFNYCLNVLWSLSVEEVFYLSFPILWLSLRQVRWVVSVWILAILVGPIYRGLHLQDDIQYLCSYPACFDAIAMGCCTALLALRVEVQPRTRKAIQAWAAIGMIWIYVSASIGSNAVIGPTAMAGYTALILLTEGASHEKGDIPRSFWSQPVAWLGRHSYELYLFHIIVLAVMRNLVVTAIGPLEKAGLFVIFFTISTALAWVIAEYYSEPLNRALRRRLIVNS